jgi:Ca2+-binding EF-hand superfamily protein
MAETPERTLEQKVEHRFSMWDTKGDGVLTEDEFVGAAQTVLDAYEESQDSPKGKAVMEGIRAFWRRHLEGMDLDNDGAITRQEYRTAIARNIRGSSGVESVVVPFWQAILDLADEDGSGALDFTEFARVMAAFGVSKNDADFTFGNIDADGNGHITPNEWLEALRQFWTSADPDAPGNTLFGRY